MGSAFKQLNTPNILGINRGGTGSNNGSILSSSSLLRITTAEGGSLIFQENGGNVGIGTTNPIATLNISSTGQQLARFERAGTGGGYIGFISGTGGTSAFQPRILGVEYGNSGNNYAWEMVGQTATDASTDLPAIFFDARNSGSALANRTLFAIGSYGVANTKFSILANGNVGIGTTSPSNPLDVIGAIISRYKASPSWPVDANGYVATYVLDNSGTKVGRILPYNGTSYIALAIGNWNSGNPNIMLATDGKVGIGKGAPGTELDVTGTIRASSQLISTVATGTAPLAVTSTTKVSNLNADLFDDYNSNQYSQWARANHMLIGGGDIIIKKNVSAEDTHIKWNQRFIVIADGKGTDFNTQGYYDITCPANEVTITGVGGSNVTTITDGIPLSAWQALYYELVPGATSSTTDNTKFKLVYYSSDLQIPANWVLIAQHNNDTKKIIPNAGLSEDFTFTDAESFQHILTIRNGLIVRRLTV